MNRVLSILIFVFVVALLISCKSTNHCASIEKEEIYPNQAEAALVITEVSE